MHSPIDATRLMTAPRADWPEVISGCELAAEFILDVNPDDIVKRLFGRGKAELERAVGDEIARPAADDADDGGIGHPLDARGDVLARHAVQCCDLLTDRHRQSGHAEIAPRAHRREVHGAGVDQKTHGRFRRGVPVPPAFASPQYPPPPPPPFPAPL